MTKFKKKSAQGSPIRAQMGTNLHIWSHWLAEVFGFDSCQSQKSILKIVTNRKVASSNHVAGKIFRREIFTKSPTHATSYSLIGNFHVSDVNCLSIPVVHVAAVPVNQ